MKRIFYAMCALLIMTICSVIFAWFALPNATANALISINNAGAGLEAKTIQISAGDVGYLEGGEGDTIVLIHGIYARKEHWVDVAKVLLESHHVIILDLPGFGDNEPLPSDQYTLANQQRNLTEVFDALNLSSVHVGANSMGAHVAALMTAAHPEKVATLAFIGSPLGVPSPVSSDMERALARGEIPLLVRSAEDFQERNAWLSPNPIDVPSPILKSWLNTELAQVQKNEQIWHAVNSDGSVPNLAQIAPDLTMETFILWCTPDRIFHISGAAILSDLLPKPTTRIMDDCGHVPMIDRPDETAQAYLDFLGSAVTP